MNVIIANDRQVELEALDIEIIKSINGVFDADELVQMFSNFFFGRMILDLTAIKNYKDIRNLQKFALSLDVEKIIVLIPDTPECLAPAFLSKMISMGIYNFTTNLDGVTYLLNNPNTYRDVAHLHQINAEDTIVSTPVYDGGGNTTVVNQVINSGPMVLGLKNITEHSGATMLIYMLKRELDKMGKRNFAIEIDKRDFTYLNEKNMVSIQHDQLGNELLKHRDCDVILVDLNKEGDENVCTDVLYLLEPSTLKLNKLMLANRRIFDKIAGRKVVLNQNVLNNSDIQELEYEAKFKTFAVIPPLDERENNSEVLQNLLSRLGIINY